MALDPYYCLLRVDLFVSAAGLFCLHLCKSLDHLQVERIPEKYILKRYTKNAKSNQTFDRRDYTSFAPDRSSMLFRHTLLLKEAMDLVRT